MPDHERGGDVGDGEDLSPEDVDAREPRKAPQSRTPPRLRPLLIAGLAVLIVIAGVVTYLVVRDDSPPTYELVGGLDAPLWLATGEESCTGDGAYSDIRGGAPVTVTDETGQTIALGQLNPGILRDRRQACRFLFEVPDVPERPFYGVEVGDRGVVRYSLAQMEASKWTVTLEVEPPPSP